MRNFWIILRRALCSSRVRELLVGGDARREPASDTTRSRPGWSRWSAALAPITTPASPLRPPDLRAALSLAAIGCRPCVGGRGLGARARARARARRRRRRPRRRRPRRLHRGAPPAPTRAARGWRRWGCGSSRPPSSRRRAGRMRRVGRLARGARRTASFESVRGSAAARASCCREDVGRVVRDPFTTSPGSTATRSPSAMPTHVIMRPTKSICARRREARTGRARRARSLGKVARRAARIIIIIARVGGGARAAVARLALAVPRFGEARLGHVVASVQALRERGRADDGHEARAGSGTAASRESCARAPRACEGGGGR